MKKRGVRGADRAKEPVPAQDDTVTRPAGPEKIVLGGGCFWCMEEVFRRIPGVVSVTPGYAGGFVPHPTYEQVCSGTTGHAEVVFVEFGPGAISLREMLGIFFSCHDPTTPDRQGADVGIQYRSIILYAGEEKRREIEAFIGDISSRYDRPVVTEVRELAGFYPAEEYHHRFYERNPGQPYCRLVIAPKLRHLTQGGGK